MFNKDEVYSSNLSHRSFLSNDKSFEDIGNEFYAGVSECLESLDLKNIVLNESNVNIGSTGFFGSSKGVKSYAIKYKEGKLKKLTAFFFVTNNGNVMNFSMYKQASFGFFDALQGVTNAADKVALIRSKLKTIEEEEEFSLFDTVADWMYNAGLSRATK